MSDTPRTDAAYFAKGATLYDLAGEAKKLERDLAAANERIEFLRAAIAKSQEEITQICGKALGYPWYKDDQKNFPGATERAGVCVGEHVAETIVAELADKYAKANERIKRLEEAGESLCQEAVCCAADKKNNEALAYSDLMTAFLEWRHIKSKKP